jgi:hypothetical protein
LLTVSWMCAMPFISMIDLLDEGAIR